MTRYIKLLDSVNDGYAVQPYRDDERPYEHARMATADASWAYDFAAGCGGAASVALTDAVARPAWWALRAQLIGYELVDQSTLPVLRGFSLPRAIADAARSRSPAGRSLSADPG